jgi:dTDP-4-dehydrorhamnose 3,5-epimerase
VRFASLGGEQLFVPAGFAHGFCTLVGETEVFYKVDAIYSPAHDAGSIGWIQLSIFPGRLMDLECGANRDSNLARDFSLIPTARPTPPGGG